MRLAPIPLFFARNPQDAITKAALSSRTTHGAREAIDACRYYAGLLLGTLQDRPKAELLVPLFSPVRDLWIKSSLAPRVATVAGGSFKTKEPPAIRGTG